MDAATFGCEPGTLGFRGRQSRLQKLDPRPRIAEHDVPFLVRALRQARVLGSDDVELSLQVIARGAEAVFHALGALGGSLGFCCRESRLQKFNPHLGIVERDPSFGKAFR